MYVLDIQKRKILYSETSEWNLDQWWLTSMKKLVLTTAEKKCTKKFNEHLKGTKRCSNQIKVQENNQN